MIVRRLWFAFYTKKIDVSIILTSCIMFKCREKCRVFSLTTEDGVTKHVLEN